MYYPYVNHRLLQMVDRMVLRLNPPLRRLVRYQSKWTRPAVDVHLVWECGIAAPGGGRYSCTLTMQLVTAEATYDGNARIPIGAARLAGETAARFADVFVRSIVAIVRVAGHVPERPSLLQILSSWVDHGV